MFLSPHGTRKRYHVTTGGFLLNEIFRRVEPRGRTIGQYLREEISKPLGIEVFIGTQDKEEQKRQRLAMASFWPLVNFVWKMLPEFTVARVVEFLCSIFQHRTCQPVYPPGVFKRSQLPVIPPRGLPDPLDMAGIFDLIDSSGMSQGEAPSINGTASARGLARLGAFVAGGGKLDGIHRRIARLATCRMTQVAKKR